MTEEWKALTDEQKQIYVQRSENEKQAYAAKMGVYKVQKAKEIAVQKEALAAAKLKQKEESKLVGKKRPATAPVAAPAPAPVAPAKKA